RTQPADCHTRARDWRDSAADGVDRLGGGAGGVTGVGGAVVAAMPGAGADRGGGAGRLPVCQAVHVGTTCLPGAGASYRTDRRLDRGDEWAVVVRRVARGGSGFVDRWLRPDLLVPGR